MYWHSVYRRSVTRHCHETNQYLMPEKELLLFVTSRNFFIQYGSMTVFFIFLINIIIFLYLHFCQNLKGQSNAIFDHQFFSSFEPIWAPDK